MQTVYLALAHGMMRSDQNFHRGAASHPIRSGPCLRRPKSNRSQPDAIVIAEHHRRRFPFASTMLGCPGGFGRRVHRHGRCGRRVDLRQQLLQPPDPQRERITVSLDRLA